MSSSTRWMVCLLCLSLVAGCLLLAACTRSTPSCSLEGVCSYTYTYGAGDSIVGTDRVCVEGAGGAACGECWDELRDGSGRVYAETCSECDLCASDFHGGGDGDADGDVDGDVDGDADGDGDSDMTPGVVDILFVVDNSNSMAEEQYVMASQIEVMVQEMLSPDGAVPAIEDLHVGVVTTDMGSGGYTLMTCENPMSGDNGVLQNIGRRDGCAPTYSSPDCDRAECPWLSHSLELPDDGTDADNPPIWEDFGCVATLGTAGCGWEQPLEASLVALTLQTGPGMANEGFLRHDSLLAIVYITDEDDCSTGNAEMFNPARDDYGPLGVRCALQPDETYPIARYHDTFVELMGGDDRRVVVAAITGVPVDGSWNPGDPLERLRDLQQVNPASPNELLRSCETAMGAAYPPVRIVELVYSFRTNGVLESICRDDWSAAFATIGRVIRDRNGAR